MATTRVSSIETHPQRHDIIAAIAAEQPYREIAKWANPPVTIGTLSRFKSRTLQKLFQSVSEAREAVANQDNLPASTVSQTVTKAALTAAVDPFRKRAIELDRERSRVKAVAEAAGKLAVWAQIDRTDLAAQEYQARLAGCMDASQGNQTNNLHVYVSIPRGAPGAEDVRPAIEVKPTE